jgi:enoyl-CoA hydratase
MTATGRMRSETRDAIGIITFDNPARHNAVSLEMWESAAGILARLRDDPAIRVVVLTGAGDKAFVSGADISRFEDERTSQAAVRRYNDAVEHMYRALAEMPKPTIAMIRGYCLGGGLGLAVCCDLRVCNDGAVFALPAAKLGLGYGPAGLRRFVDVLGPAVTKEIFFTARRYDAATALRWGLVNHVVPGDTLDGFVMEMAATIAANAPLTIATVKAITRELAKDPDRRDLAACEAMVARCFASQDYVEGRRAFLEKRKPVFTGT